MSNLKSYDDSDPESILAHAKKLIGKSLSDLYTSNLSHGGKGEFGQLLEELHFGKKLDSESKPDFPKANLELKSSPLILRQRKGLVVKERLVLNIINYEKLDNENWKNSSFLQKNKNLLLIFYRWKPNTPAKEYIIEHVDLFTFPTEDISIIKSDWNKIWRKNHSGNAHKISESDTTLLAACTKGTNKKSVRIQPKCALKAKQRAFSLKSGYMTYIYYSIIGKVEKKYQKLISDQTKIISGDDIDNFILNRYKEYLGKSIDELYIKFKLDLNKNAKNFYSIASRHIISKILGLETTNKIRELEKSNTEIKTIRLRKNGTPKEDISFPAFRYNGLVEEEWDESEFKEYLSKRYLFIVFRYNEQDKLILDNVLFWRVPEVDLDEAKKIWILTIDLIKQGKYGNLPSKKNSHMVHVRPHGRNKKDTFPTPDGKKATKKSFWLNAKYIKEQLIEYKNN